MPDEIAPGLWRWIAPHPEWQPSHDDGTPRDWPREVGCVLYETDGRAVFIDPQAPEDDPAFWRWADERCDGREVSVLETTACHRRSRERFVARYAAPSTPDGGGQPAPDSIEAYPLAAFEETLYWVAEHRALVPGDVLIGDGGGELRLCPESWLDDFSPRPTLGEMRAALGVLSELDIELVLVSHGEPALRHGGAALARALHAAPAPG